MFLYEREFTASQLAKAAYFIASAASPLLIKALWKGPLAAFEFSWRALEVYKELVQSEPIPAMALAELRDFTKAGQQIWIDLTQPSSEMPPGELAILCSLVKWKNPQVVVEVGTYRGFTTLHLSRNTADTCRIFTVDLPPKVARENPSAFSDPQLVQAAGKMQRVFGNDPKIIQILQDSTTIEWEKVLDCPVDFALVDASHLYEHVRGDTEGIMKVLAPNALLVWHDYRPVELRRGVRKYLLECHTNGLPLRRFASTSFCVYQHARKGHSLREGVASVGSEVEQLGYALGIRTC